MALFTSFALIGLTVVLFAMWQRASSGDGIDQERLADEGQLLEARRALELSTLSIVATRMLDDIGMEGDRSDRLSLAAADVRAATAAIAELAEGEGSVAAEAQVLLDDVDIDALEDPIEGSLEELFYVAEESARFAGTIGVVTTQQAAIHQLSFVAAVPLHIVIEGIAADVSVNERPFSEENAEHFEYLIDVVRTDGGWLGPDADAPLDNSVWITIDEARQMLPAETALLSNTVATNSLVTYDAWMRGLADGFDAPPMDLLVASDLADGLQAELSGVIDGALATAEAERDSVIAAQESESRTLLIFVIVAGALALVALIAGVLGIARAARTARERAALALLDALTGIGNRHELEERTRVLAADPRFDHHLVAMIDLDRFKMVNDVHGHAAGDAILVEVASALQRMSLEWSDDEPAVETSVVRLGGDEFLMTLHGPRPFEAEAVRAQLDALRSEWLDYSGERIALGFSVGIVQVEGPNDLADLMGAADLAVYDDKAARAHERKSAAGELPPSDLDVDRSTGASRS